MSNSDPSNPGGGRKLLDIGAVEIAARTIGQMCFGNELQFFDGFGNPLGTKVLDDPTNLCTSTPTDLCGVEATGGYVFRSFDVPSSFLPTEGGFICLLGYDFTRLLSYGTTSSIAVPCSQSIGLTTEDVADDTTDIPDMYQSFQRIGFGHKPEDFMWKVQGPKTFDRVNDGQEYPCGDDELNCVYGNYNSATQTCDCFNGGVKPSSGPGYCYDANGACTIYKEYNPTTNMFDCSEPGGDANNCIHGSWDGSACVCDNADNDFIQGFCLDVNGICACAQEWTGIKWACPPVRDCIHGFWDGSACVCQYADEPYQGYCHDVEGICSVAQQWTGRVWACPSLRRTA
jgi:hypothetical protein